MRGPMGRLARPAAVDRAATRAALEPSVGDDAAGGAAHGRDVRVPRFAWS